MTELAHQPSDLQCIAHLKGQPGGSDVVCPVCRPAEYEAQPHGQYGRCEAFDDGGDAHFRQHICNTPLKADGTCPWHGAVPQ